MNVNPQAINVLCFGDSNTFGTRPDTHHRFLANERWTGILQANLGDEYYIIEEGLGGRTTNLESPDPAKPGRNGYTYFEACLHSHIPLHVIVIMLGTNDLKFAYKRSAADIAQALQQYPDYITSYCTERSLPRPKIVLVSPVSMSEDTQEITLPVDQKVYDDTSITKSKELSTHIEAVAEQTGCLFYDADSVCATGEDGLQLDLQSHADALTQIVRTS